MLLGVQGLVFLKACLVFTTLLANTIKVVKSVYKPCPSSVLKWL